MSRSSSPPNFITTVGDSDDTANKEGIGARDGKGDFNQDVSEIKLIAREGDRKVRQEFKGTLLAWLAYQSIGVIYGDIGTSPLYVYSSTFTSEPSYDDLLGVLSLIIWTLTIVVTIKYVLIVLRADDEGEGGTFAVYSLLSRYANIAKRSPKETSMIKIERHNTQDLGSTNRNVRSLLERSSILRALLKGIGIIGVALVMADGVLTPAQSVLGAIQGLKVVRPDITTDTIVGITCAILVLLFLVQPFGTSKIASTFAPIVIIWLIFNFSFGIYNLAIHDASVLKAFSPYYAGHYFVRNKTDGWKSLGGILLAFTGVEALFADLGAFSRRAVQISWLFFAFPCLLLAYIGQAAYISYDRSAYSNPFFNTVPPGMYYPGLVMSILAAIVASQAMITSAFQLLSQVMKMSFFPQIKSVHTSTKFHGHVYIPLANWALLVGSIIVTTAYSDTTRLGNAYGVCVILVTTITTCMVSLVALVVWRLHWAIVLAGFLVFGTFDGLYLSAAAVKIPDGAWFAIVLAGILSAIFILWRYGKEKQWLAEGENLLEPGQVRFGGKAASDETVESLEVTVASSQTTEIPGVGIFFDKVGTKVPVVFQQFLHKLQAVHEITIFFHMRPLFRPYVLASDRLTITRTSLPNTFRVVVRHGYMENVISADLAHMLTTELRGFLVGELAGAQSHKALNGLTNPTSIRIAGEHAGGPSIESIESHIAALDKASQRQMTYIVGKEQMRIPSGTNWAKKVVLMAFLWLRENTRTKVAAMNIPVDRLVEIGFVKEFKQPGGNKI